MRAFSLAPERLAHTARWILLAGWIYLVASLLAPTIAPDIIARRLIGDQLNKEFGYNDGPLIFWGVIVPLGILIIFVLSHELWRRLCPLAFASQLFRAIGKQRLVMVKGKPMVAKVNNESWLHKNHIKLQWSLFITGITFRLLFTNGNPVALGLFLLATILSAIFVGWAYGGKAWCQYFCPMAPVQSILIGPKSYLGGDSHTTSTTKVTQSMCRTVDSDGKEQSSCIACQNPCIDIDSERAYWSSLNKKRALSWAWYSYPGIILCFFLLMQAVGDGDRSYLSSRHWAYDEHIWERVGKPLDFFAREKHSSEGKAPPPLLLPTAAEIQINEKLRRLSNPQRIETTQNPENKNLDTRRNGSYIEPTSKINLQKSGRSNSTTSSMNGQQAGKNSTSNNTNISNESLPPPMQPPDFNGNTNHQPGKFF